MLHQVQRGAAQQRVRLDGLRDVCCGLAEQLSTHATRCRTRCLRVRKPPYHDAHCSCNGTELVKVTVTEENVPCICLNAWQVLAYRIASARA